MAVKRLKPLGNKLNVGEAFIELHAPLRAEHLHVVAPALYGPNYHTNRPELHFIYDLIRKIGRGKRFGEPVTLWGDGSQQRDQNQQRARGPQTLLGTRARDSQHSADCQDHEQHGDTLQHPASGQRE